jgi:hypothetical protein
MSSLLLTSSSATSSNNTSTSGTVSPVGPFEWVFAVGGTDTVAVPMIPMSGVCSPSDLQQRHDNVYHGLEREGDGITFVLNADATQSYNDRFEFYTSATSFTTHAAFAKDMPHTHNAQLLENPIIDVAQMSPFRTSSCDGVAFPDSGIFTDRGSQSLVNNCPEPQPFSSPIRGEEVVEHDLAPTSWAEDLNSFIASQSNSDSGEPQIYEPWFDKMLDEIMAGELVDTGVENQLNTSQSMAEMDPTRDQL